MNSNLCEKHFPEPIIYMTDQPLCKKCIPEFMAQMAKAHGKEKEENTQQKEQAE